MAMTKKEVMKRYRERHRERLAEAAREYARTHRAEINAKLRLWRAKDPEKHRAKQRAWYAADPERSKQKARRAALAKFGLTMAEYDALLHQQGGTCAICKRTDSAGRHLAVDHNHNTDEVRGLLCSNCNPGIGYFNDSPALLRAAIDYLNARTS
jgi:hypothetical protein